MEKDQLSRKLAVILHADVVGSTALVQQNEALAHKHILATFNRFYSPCQHTSLEVVSLYDARGGCGMTWGVWSDELSLPKDESRSAAIAVFMVWFSSR